MKKLQELIALRESKRSEFQAMELTEETRDGFDALENEITVLDTDIERLERQEAMNQKIASVNIIPKIVNDEAPNFARSLNEYLVKGSVSEDFRGSEGIVIPSTMFRADPVLTTTDTGIINKIVEPEINIKKSFGEQFLRDLGVRFYDGINGNLVLPSMAESTAVQTAEAGDSSTADQTPSSITLSAKRLDHFNGYTREFLAQTSTYPSLLQDLIDGIGTKMVYQFFDNMQVDANDASVAPATAGPTYADVVGLEANLADVMGDPKFVGTPSFKAYLKSLNASAAGIKFVWTDANEIIGIPAVAANGVNANQLWLGDWSKAAVATFGSGAIEVVVDPYSSKKQGLIDVYAVQLVDSGTANYRNFSYLADASISL